MSNAKGLGISAVKASPDLSEEAVSPRSPFDDDIDADTTFGQSSNAYDSSAMARSLNLESATETKVTPIDPGDRYGLRRVLNANMLHAAETGKVDATDRDSLMSHVRAADTPPNSPKLHGADLDEERMKRPLLFRGRRYGPSV
jgi:hypothetical protein